MADRIEKFALGWYGTADRRAIHVGLVNNMPDTAMRATELQFARLLKQAAGALDVRLHLFSLAEIARSDLARSRMEGFYADAATLPQAGIDALIVTGAVPQAGDLRDEPYWPSLSHLVDWAEIGTVSTIWSCLAAHAAVLHLDDIVRHPLRAKLSGVFDCERVSEDPLLFGMPALTAVPHSRYNEVSEDALAAKGYRILRRLPHRGVDLFTRQSRSLFIFQQGHPEYDSETLGREYCRDFGCFLRGERGARPAIPENYFDAATEAAIAELADCEAEPDLLARMVRRVSAAAPIQSWRSDAVTFFTNWLRFVANEKSRRAARHDFAHPPPLRRRA